MPKWGVFLLLVIAGTLAEATAGGAVLFFGPERLIRTEAPSDSFSRTFPLPPEIKPPYLFSLKNAVDESRKVASATVILNGAQVIGPHGLEQGSELVRSVTLGSVNELVVTLAGIPGSFVTVSLRGQENRLPVAHAGADQSVGVGTVATLNGSGSYDLDGDPLTYRWSFAALPVGSAVKLSDPVAVAPSFTPDVVGNYVVQLVVSDGVVESATDFVEVVGLSADPMIQKTIGPAGGTIELQGTLNHVMVEIPADALAADTELTIRQVPTPPAGQFYYPGIPIGNTFSFEPHDLKFNRVVNVTFTYRDEDIPEGEEEGRLVVYYASSLALCVYNDGTLCLC